MCRIEFAAGTLQAARDELMHEGMYFPFSMARFLPCNGKRFRLGAAVQTLPGPRAGTGFIWRGWHERCIFEQA
jgi:hypothetical protein